MKALIIQGGWEGHEPEITTALFAKELIRSGFEVDVSDSLEILDDASQLSSYQLIMPNWTMGSPAKEQIINLSKAVRGGTGLGGFHGGMGDAFRGQIEYEWMVGGHFVGHPHVGEYMVNIIDHKHPITAPLPDQLTYDSEQYYMLMDPGVTVLADSIYHHAGMDICMPVIWTKSWGDGRVFYSALGHKAAEFGKYPAVLKMTVEGLKWAARAI